MKTISFKSYNAKTKRIEKSHLKKFKYSSTGISNNLNKSIISTTDGESITFDEILFKKLKDYFLYFGYDEFKRLYYNTINENGFIFKRLNEPVFNKDFYE